MKDASSLQSFSATEKFIIPKYKVSHLLPEVFEEHIVKVFAKDPEKVRSPLSCGSFVLLLCTLLAELGMAS